MTRQELYDQIRQSSKEQVVLEGMIRLGFWDSDDEMPSVPEQFIRKQTELQQELRSLLSEQKSLKDPKKMLKQMRQEKLKASREKQQETKEKRETARQERADAWAAKQKTDIVYLGEGISKGLGNTESDEAKLRENGLPYFPTVADLAQAMGISVNELRFLTFQRKVSRVHHYKQFSVPKKTGGVREISAPMPRLKTAQHWVLHHILYKIAPNEAANGFVPTRSIVTNAQTHLKAETVINLDLQDFFPTIVYKRVWGLFRQFGYSVQISTILALLCTETKVDETTLDGIKYFVQKGERVLPQGAPTSPAITNLICRGLDKALTTIAKSYNLNYSRYADDMTFSGHFDRDEDLDELREFMKTTRHIIASHGFIIHPKKVRIMGRGNRQEVTGIVVNEKPSLEAKKLKNFRALLFQIEQSGLKGKSWNGKEGISMLYAINGFAHYVNMVIPEKGARFVTQVQALWKRHLPQLQHDLAMSATTEFLDRQEIPEISSITPQSLPQIVAIITETPQSDEEGSSDEWRVF